MAKHLVIVESPAKAGTIAKYLGPDFEVLASMGHVRDLPASKLGVDIEHDFLPQYIIPIKARKTVNSLKAALKGKERVLLATDLDREGEAIAWHIAHALDLEKTNLVVQRITFDEITKTAIQAAVLAPRDINIALVDAQQARRVLDRLVGYTLSPLLWKKLYRGLSAGRVQSVALRLIVDRERERTAFTPVEYWSLTGTFLAPTNDELTAQLVQWQGEKVQQFTLTTSDQVAAIKQALEHKPAVLAGHERKEQRRRPQPPYTTSSMQQDAVNKLGISAKRVMQLAQKLYESGHITYMRTDSVNLASVAVEAIRGYVTQEFGAEYLPAKANIYAAKSKNAQEAHEAIRPTSIDLEMVPAEPLAQRLYTLIRSRALACQMADARVEQLAYSIEMGQGVFRATGQRILFPGFLAAYPSDERTASLPELPDGTAVTCTNLKDEQHFTEPPPRFSEATLIKVLEEQGIGRPSTYAPTIDTLVQRRYIVNEQRRLVPEEVGYLVTDLLVEHFPNIVDPGFTASMEEQLDTIADGDGSYTAILSSFWEPFSAQVEREGAGITKVEITETTDAVCPTCGSPMQVKMGRFGKFLACSNFPECKTTQPLEQAPETGLTCPVCGKPFAEKRARRGVFFGCSGYPTCTVALWKREHLPAKITELEGEGVAVPFKEQALAAFEVLGIDPLPLPIKRAVKTTDAAPKKKPAAKKTTVKKSVAKKAPAKATAKKVPVKKASAKSAPVVSEE